MLFISSDSATTPKTSTTIRKLQSGSKQTPYADHRPAPFVTKKRSTT
jgi:hypothetical protein